MPVVFYVDPAFGNDPDMSDIAQLTLGYTFFRSADPRNAKDLSRFLTTNPPDPVEGKTFSMSNAPPVMRSTSTDRPGLGDAFGRRAGAVPGYEYSPAIRSAGLTWSADNLNRWLASPKKLIPGAKMPVSVPDPIARRDIIAYLQQESERGGGGLRGKTTAHDTGY